MCKKGSHIKSDYIPWNDMLSVVRKLFKDGKYRISLLIGSGAFLGLRISDLRILTWNQLLNEEGRFTITEKKTKKTRTLKVNQEFKEHVKACYEALGCPPMDEACFLSRKHTIYSTQRINIILKDVKQQYKLKVDNISSHSLRKCFGRRVYELAAAKDNGETALIKLSEIFNHSSVAITKIYLGLRTEELEECYEMLDFV